MERADLRELGFFSSSKPGTFLECLCGLGFPTQSTLEAHRKECLKVKADTGTDHGKLALAALVKHREKVSNFFEDVLAPMVEEAKKAHKKRVRLVKEKPR